MIPPEKRKALETATVDARQVQQRPSGEIHIPVTAVKSSATFTESDLGSYTLTYLETNWFITD